MTLAINPLKVHGLNLNPTERFVQSRGILNAMRQAGRPVVNASATTLENLLRANQEAKFLEKIQDAELVYADTIHVDLFDPAYVGTNNLDVYTPELVRKIALRTGLPIDVHFMVQPKTKGGLTKFREEMGLYIGAGARFASFHWGAFVKDGLEGKIAETLLAIREMGACAGLVINPNEDGRALLQYSDMMDFALVMTVMPGAGGGALDERGFANLKILQDRQFSKLVGNDGAMSDKTIKRAWNLGSRWFVVGSYLFGKDPLNDVVEMGKRFGSLVEAVILPE